MSSPSNPFLTPKAVESWLTLMLEATRGVQSAQQAMETFAALPNSTTTMGEWMQRFMPGAVPSAIPGAAAAFSPQSMEKWLEEWQTMMGVVPRARYLELLERNAELERQLASATETIDALRNLLDRRQASEEAAAQALDNWQQAMNQTVQTQASWMQDWMKTLGGAAGATGEPLREDDRRPATDGGESRA